MIRKRLVLLLWLLPSAAFAADLSGTWTIAGPITPSCTFTQAGNSLGGACRGPGAEGPLTGSIDGQTVKWVFTRTNMASGRTIAPVEFVATLSGQTMTGIMTQGGANPAPFTARLAPGAASIQLTTAKLAQPATPPPPTPAPQPAASGVNTAPPRTVFDIDLDGSAVHQQSGLICPVTAAGWARNSTIQYDKPGFDVSCGYRSPGGSEITIYLSRRSASILNQVFQQARETIPKNRPDARSREGTAAAPPGFDWLKAGFEEQQGEIWSDLFLSQLSDWEYEARITYKPADLPAVNAVFAELSATVARTAGKQLAACAAAAASKRGAQRITDANDLRAYSVSAAAQARAVIAASRGNGLWCAEGSTSGTHTSDYWRNIAVDEKAPAVDRLTGVDNDIRVVIAGNAAATAAAAKSGTPRQVYDVLMERPDDVILVAEFDGRPSPDDLVKEILSQPRIGIYASVNKATSNITFFNPAPPPPAPAQ